MDRKSSPLARTVNDAGRTAGATGAVTSGERPGFLDWVTQLVHTHRARLYRVAKREGLREEDSFDAVQDAWRAWRSRTGDRLRR